ncbi:MAG: hypothetical protein AAF604_15685 [Acidobacteriota bacterium]
MKHPLFTLAVVGLSLVLVAPLAAQPVLELVDAEDTPRRASAHQSVRLCFVGAVLSGDPTIYWSFNRNGKELGGQPGFADGTTQTCFTIPAVAEAGKWINCQKPKEAFHEVYNVTAKIDTAGAPAGDAAHRYAGQTSEIRWAIDREVTEFEERPTECAGDWTWTFKAGVLKCQKLPFPVALPGFSEPVAVSNDGLRMEVTGSRSGEQLVLLREADVKVGSTYLPHFEGYQNMSRLLGEGGPAIRAKYEINLVDDDWMEGKLTVDKARYQGDVCSIEWFYEVKR